MSGARGWVRVFRQNVQIGEQINGSADGNGTYLNSASAKYRWEEPLANGDEFGEIGGHKASGDTEVRTSGDTVNGARDLVAEYAIFLPQFGPKHLLNGILERIHAGLYGWAGVELADGIVK